jgi:hypothetical protein
VGAQLAHAAWDTQKGTNFVISALVKPTGSARTAARYALISSFARSPIMLTSVSGVPALDDAPGPVGVPVLESIPDLTRDWNSEDTSGTETTGAAVAGAGAAGAGAGSGAG